MQTSKRSSRLLDALDCSPWGASSGRSRRAHGAARTLYTPEERRRRDVSPWTMVQGVLAPFQFAVFLVSLALVTRFLLTGEGLEVATWSVVIKTVVLYAIMVTGSIWEKEVFGRWLFARAFFWEDVFSMLVLALHTAYLYVIWAGIGDGRAQMMLALAAYAAYVFNAAQFLLKLRAARRDEAGWNDRGHPAQGAAG
ncbi:2-vinyl bacteriochlorophyllide hydratase [Roseomonas sp. PWR1]|uniref:2-vinyl bacteriochlorophyllide hydratase n=1 Tax=Roseomonas nitratireducens TaxID=2820810 RepID=A0ABS4APP2_9PROT|nr:2-vinyl bacteriochlorophyllide hydratase [Neoroseomonas nitratireducens]MBP0463328.1 2-vinyl bacteriochlorophyllide hydratase [Neoroseomonas nitratireducens]